MQGGGCRRRRGATIARRLVDSNLVGHDSHGVLRVGKYLEWMRDGTLKPNTPPTIVFDSDTHRDRRRQSRLRPGDRRVRRRSSASPRRRGRASRWSACATADTSGRLGDWAEMAAAAGQVSLHFLNTSGAQRVAPFGGSDRRLSTNPIAIGVPLAGARSGDSRHHDVDRRRRQADGRAEQGRAGAARDGSSTGTASRRRIRRTSTTAARCSPSARTRARGCRSSPTCSPAR